MLERRVISILFADLVGSTQLAGQLDPEELRELMARYRDTVATVVARLGGTMEKFIGDAALALFGYPGAHDDDPMRAVRAAFDIRDAVAAMPGTELQVRVGICTGEVVADPAAADRSEFIVTGEPVHRAQRLQAAASPGEILVDERTRLNTRASVGYEALRPLELKGSAAAVPAFRALALEEHGQAIPDPEFVGRRHELALLELLFDRVRQERTPHLVTLIGPPGIGKTRLVDEFWRRIQHRETDVLMRVGGCKPYGEAALYCPISAVLAAEFPDELETAHEPDEFLSIVKHRLQEVCEESGRPDVPCDRLASLYAWAVRDDVGLDPPADRAELFHLWRLPLDIYGRRAPVIVAYDNLHWSSEEPLDFVESIPAKLHDVPVLIIGIARPELLERRPTWGGGSGGTTILQLGPLGPEDTDQLTRHLLGAAADEELLDVLRSRSEGNPHFVIEFIRSQVESGTIERVDDGGYRLVGSPEDLRVPDSVQAAVATRIDGLPPDEKRLLLQSSYAAYSRWFFDRPIRMLGEQSDAEIDAALDGLMAKGLIVEVEPAGAPGTPMVVRGTRQFRYSHLMFREVAHDMVPKAERPRLQLALVDWLDEVAKQLPGSSRIVAQIAAVNSHAAWQVLADRGVVDQALAGRTVDYCLAAAATTAACGAMQEAAELVGWAEDVGRVLPNRLAEIRSLAGRIATAPQAI